MSASTLGQCNRDPTRIRLHMFQVDNDLRPVGSQSEALRPLNNDDGRFSEGVLERQGLKTMEVFDAIKVHMVDLDMVAKHVHQGEGRASDFFLSSYAQSTDDPFGDRSLTAT